MGILTEGIRSFVTGRNYDPMNVVPDLYDDVLVRASELDYSDGRFSGFRIDLGVAEQVGGPYRPRFKYLCPMRLTRIAPIEIQRAAEGLALVDLHTKLIMGLVEQGIHPVTLVANDPHSLGLLFCAGVQAMGSTPQEAKAAALSAARKLKQYYVGVYRQCNLRNLTNDEAHWLHVRLQSWTSLAVFRGIPQPRREASTGLVTPLAGITQESTVEQQIEQFCRAMANDQFIFMVLASPLSHDSILHLLKGVNLQLEKLRSDVQVQESHTAGVSLPFLFAGTSGGSQGLSHGLSSNLTHTQGLSEGRSVGESVSQSLTQTHGVSESISHNFSKSDTLGTGLTQGHSASLSHSYGQSLSASHSQSTQQTSSYSLSHGINESRGETMSQGITRSTGVTVGQNQSHSTSYSDGTSVSNSESLNQGVSNSLATNSSHSASLSASSGRTQGVGSSTNVKGGGDLFFVNGGVGLAHSTTGLYSDSGSANIGSSVGVSSTSGSTLGSTLGSTQGSSQSFGATTSMGTSQSLSQSVANSSSLSNSATVGSSTSLSLGRSVSEGTSTGLTQGVSSTVSAGQSGSVGLSSSVNQGVSSGVGTSMGASQSTAQGVTSGQSQGASVSSSAGMSEGTGQSSGDALGSSWGMSGSMGIAPMISISKTKPIYDEQKRVLATMLQTQQNRLTLARQEALFQGHCFLLAPTPEVKMAGVGAAMTAFWGTASSGGDLPTRFHALSELEHKEEKHILEHVKTFSGCHVREPSTIGLERGAYSTVLTATELAIITHPPRIDLPGIQVSFEPIPPFRVPVDADGEIHLGRIVNPEIREVTPYRYGFDPARMCHTLILGETRQGKSVSATQIFVNWVNRAPARLLVHEDGSAYEKLVPYGALVLDWKSEWRGVLHHVPPERFRFISLWNSKLGFKYNPLEVPDGIPASIHLDTFSEALALAMNLGQRGRGLIRRTLRKLYLQPRSMRLVDPNASPGSVGTVFDDYRLSRFIGMADLYTEVDNALRDALSSRSGNSEKDGLQVLQMRLQNFAPGEEMAKIYTRDITEDELQHDPMLRERYEHGEFAIDGCLRLSDLIGPGEIVVMEGGPLENAVKKALVTSIATAIFTWARIRGRNAFNPEHLLVLEEAHEVLTGGDSSAAEIGGINETVWEQMWNEGGGLGLRLMAIAQMAERVPESVIANSSSTVIHKLGSEKSQQMAMIAISKDWRVDDRPLRRFIGNIPQGWAIVRSVSSGIYEDADPVLVHPDYLRLEEPSDEQLRHYSIRKRAQI